MTITKSVILDFPFRLGWRDGKGHTEIVNILLNDERVDIPYLIENIELDDNNFNGIDIGDDITVFDIACMFKIWIYLIFY